MKNIKLALCFSLALLSTNVFAEGSLKNVCDHYKGGGVFQRNVGIFAYNVNTVEDKLNVSISPNGYFFQMALQDQIRMAIYDMVRTAFLTGNVVNICYNPNEKYLLGMEMADWK